MTVEIIGFVIVVIVMAVVVVRRQYIKIQLKERRAMDDAADRLRLQIEEVADSVISRMENRIDHLEMLIGEADAKIIDLDDKLKEIQRKEEEAALAAAAVAACVKEEEPPARLLDKERAEAPQEVSAPHKLEKKFPAKELSPINKRVLDLFEDGCPLDDIARKTGMGKGAILMIKEMYKK